MHVAAAESLKIDVLLTTCDDRVISFVQSMLDPRKQLAGAEIGHDKTPIQRQIDAIDRLVYELYGLSDDEIRIVEEVTNG